MPKRTVDDILASIPTRASAAIWIVIDPHRWDEPDDDE